jgi:hypothetical protein
VLGRDARTGGVERSGFHGPDDNRDVVGCKGKPQRDMPRIR